MWSAGLRLGRLAWWPEVFTQPKDSEGYPSGQRGQTVNLLAYAFGGSNPPPSTRFKRYKCFVEVDANHRNRNVGSTDSPGAKRRGPGGAEGRTPGVIHLPPPDSRGTNVSLRWMRTTGTEMSVRPIRRERIGTRREAARPRRGGGQDARSHPPPSTFTLESGGRPPSTGLHATEPDRLRQRTPLMRE